MVRHGLFMPLSSVLMKTAVSTILQKGANAQSGALLEREEGSKEAAHLLERQAFFGPPTFCCSCMVLKWSLA